MAIFCTHLTALNVQNSLFGNWMLCNHGNSGKANILSLSISCVARGCRSVDLLLKEAEVGLQLSLTMYVNVMQQTKDYPSRRTTRKQEEDEKVRVVTEISVPSFRQ